MAQTADFTTRAAIGDLTIGIIGLGYVGLPTAIGFLDAGFNVWGVDVSQRTVDLVKAGKTRPATLMLTISSLHQAQNAGTLPILRQKQYLIAM